jgi:hypothetical protein
MGALGSESGWMKGSFWLAHVARLLRYWPNMLFADLALVLLVARTKRARDEATSTVVDTLRLVPIGGALMLTVLFVARVMQLVTHEANVSARFAAAGESVELPSITKGEINRLGTPTIVFRDDVFFAADLDRDESWEPATPRPIVRHVVPMTTMFPQSITLKDAADRLEPITGRGILTYLVAREKGQTKTTGMAAAFAPPPLRIVPVILALDPDEQRNIAQASENVSVRIREGIAEIASSRLSDQVEIDLTKDGERAAKTIAEACVPPFHMSAGNGLVILTIDDRTTLATALRMAEILVPGLDLTRHGGGRTCRFAAIAFASTFPR